MKVSTAIDGSLIVRCQHFSCGAEDTAILKKSTFTELIYLFFIAIIFIASFDFTKISVNTDNIIFAVYCVAWGSAIIYAIFFKTLTIKVLDSYQIDLKNCLSAHPPYPLYQKIRMIRDKNEIAIVDGIEMVRDVEVQMSTYSDDDDTEFPASAKTVYKVVITFKSRESSIIESNFLDVASCEDNQIAFRKLMVETQATVEQINSFIAASTK
jgi:L-ribulose-5-phosphate 3-epimerase UlaE